MRKKEVGKTKNERGNKRDRDNEHGENDRLFLGRETHMGDFRARVFEIVDDSVHAGFEIVIKNRPAGLNKDRILDRITSVK
jgi:hypothetical protein